MRHLIQQDKRWVRIHALRMLARCSKKRTSEVCKMSKDIMIQKRGIECRNFAKEFHWYFTKMGVGKKVFSVVLETKRDKKPGLLR